MEEVVLVEVMVLIAPPVVRLTPPPKLRLRWGPRSHRWVVIFPG